MKKPGWLRHAIAKEDGFYAKNGEKLKNKRLTPEYVAEWNGVKKAKPAPAPEPVVEEAAVEEVVEEEPVVEEAPVKKTVFGRKKKK